MSNLRDRRFRAALVQLRSGRSVAANLDTGRGADPARRARRRRLCADAGEHRAHGARARSWSLPRREPRRRASPLKRLRALAAELGIHLHIGSLAIKLDGTRVANRSYLIDPEGEIAARYDKLHLFDVDLAGGESYRESRHVAAGRQGGARRPAVRPARALASATTSASRSSTARSPRAGAEFIAVPAAFTRQTGEAHWHVLIRARAIETGAFVLAATQGGLHENGRATFGHSLIVSPWGEVLAEAGEEPGVIFADIDLAASAEARARIPALKHGRDFEVEIVQAAPAQARKSAP